MKRLVLLLALALAVADLSRARLSKRLYESGCCRLMDSAAVVPMLLQPRGLDPTVVACRRASGDPGFLSQRLRHETTVRALSDGEAGCT